MWNSCAEQQTRRWTGQTRRWTGLTHLNFLDLVVLLHQAWLVLASLCQASQTYVDTACTTFGNARMLLSISPSSNA